MRISDWSSDVCSSDLQQRAAGAAAGGVDRDHGDWHLREAGEEAVEEFVGERGLAGAAGAGDADDRGLGRGGLPLLAEHGEFRLGEVAVLDRGHESADADFFVERGFRGAGGALGTSLPCPRVARLGDALDDVLDHFHQAQLHAVVGVVDALDAVGFQLPDLFGRDGAAAAADHADVPGAVLAEHVDHVLHVFDVAALVAGQGDGVGVFLQGGADDVLYRAVVAEVDDFGALRLDQPPHDVDGGVVAVEQAGGGDEAQRGGVGLGGRVCAFDGAGGWRAHGALRLKTGWGDCSVGTLGGRIGAARIHRRPPLVVGRGYAPDAPRTPTDSSQTFAGVAKSRRGRSPDLRQSPRTFGGAAKSRRGRSPDLRRLEPLPQEPGRVSRSEEHTSELQSLMRISYAVFCLKYKTILTTSIT